MGIGAKKKSNKLKAYLWPFPNLTFYVSTTGYVANYIF